MFVCDAVEEVWAGPQSTVRRIKDALCWFGLCGAGRPFPFSLCVVGLLFSPPTMTPDVALQSRFVALALHRTLGVGLNCTRNVSPTWRSRLRPRRGAVFTPLDVQHVVLMMSMFYNLSLLIEPCS